MIDHVALRRNYLLEIAHRLRGKERDHILARAEALIRKWELAGNVRPCYIDDWRATLRGGADQVEAVARSDTAEAAELRHCMPFAGILTNRDRLALRDKA